MVPRYSLMMLKSFAFNFHEAIVESWQDVMVIPERNLALMEDTTSGLTTKMPSLLRALIIRKCQLESSSVSSTFPYISPDLDLIIEDAHPFHIHILPTATTRTFANPGQLLLF